MKFYIHKSISTVAITSDEDNHANFSLRTATGKAMFRAAVEALVQQGHQIYRDGILIGGDISDLVASEILVMDLRPGQTAKCADGYIYRVSATGREERANALRPDHFELCTFRGQHFYDIPAILITG